MSAVVHGRGGPGERTTVLTGVGAAAVFVTTPGADALGGFAVVAVGATVDFGAEEVVVDTAGVVVAVDDAAVVGSGTSEAGAGD